MDPLSLTVATLLVSRAAEAFGGAAGQGVWDGLRRLGAFVRRAVAGDPAGTDATDEQSGQSEEARVTALADALERRLAAEPGIREELAALLERAQQERAPSRFVTEVNDSASVGKIANIGDVRGNVSF